MTVTPTERLTAIPDAAAKAAWIAGMRKFLDDYEASDDAAPVPSRRLNIPVPLRDADGDRLPRDARVALLRETAAGYGLSEPDADGMGNTIAYRFYGPLQVYALVGAEVMRHDTYVATAAAFRAAQAGTEAAA